jgi:uncharacterized membrane-anchored protein YitT (DUF2179 family)
MSQNTKAAELYNWMLVLVGSALTALAYNLFFIPNNIAPGGLAGFAQELNALFGFHIGLTIAVLNVPLFIIGWRIRGGKFMLRTFVSTLLLSALIDYMKLPQNVYNLFNSSQGSSSDLLLTTLFGGIIMGAGVGLTIRGNATTGGTDLIAIIGNHWFPNLNVAWILFGVDFTVVVLAAFIFEPMKALYALVAVFIGSRVVDFIQTGARSAKVFYIISKKSDVITDHIIHKLDRGVTILYGRGAFSGKDKEILFCLVTPQQITPMKKLIAEEDPEAFVVVSDAKEVLGEGFMPHKK